MAFVLLDNWSELPAAYAPYADAMAPRVIEDLEAKRRQVYNWWTHFKASQQRRIEALISRSFARASGGA